MAIRDNKNIRELEDQLSQWKLLLDSPLAHLLPNREELRRTIAQNEDEMRKLIDVPDRFNQRFATLGWIAFEQMNAEVMSNAVIAFDNGGAETAEMLLEEYWQDRDTVKLWARGLYRFDTVKHRRRLVDLAIEDHFAGRYHASVPVILAQIDGIVHDLSNTTFYKKPGKADHLLIPNTIAGAASGLPFLAGLMSEKRDSTLKEPTNLPYRHGIQHGRDLSYDNRRTSTKAIVALLALTAWIKALHEDPSFQPPEIQEYFKPPLSGPTLYEDIPKMILGLGDYRESFSYNESSTHPLLSLAYYLHEEESEDQARFHSLQTLVYGLIRPFIHTSVESVEVRVHRNSLDNETELSVMLTKSRALTVLQTIWKIPTFEHCVGEYVGENNQYFFENGWSKRIRSHYFKRERLEALLVEIMRQQ